MSVYDLTAMKPSSALALHRDDVRRLVEDNRARNPRVFGSALNGNDTEFSDIDILVDPLPGATLFDLGGLQVALQDLLGVSVDLLTPDDLPQRLREQVLREAIPV
jgi:predicted nucleotidyltransferase